MSKILKTNQQDIKYQKIKLLSKCLLNPNLNASILLEDLNEFNNNFKYRMFNHILIYPKILVYINEHLNHLYIFDKYPDKWIKTFSTILRYNDIKSLYYSKWKASLRDNFFNDIKEYNRNTESREFNLNELKSIYQLYINKVITKEQYDKFKLIDSSQVVKIDKYSLQDTDFKKEEKEIIPNKFVNNLKDYIKNRTTCKVNCKFYGKDNPIILDSNINPGEKIDILYLSLSSKEFDISPLKTDTFKYVHSSILLCDSNTDESVTQLKENIKTCKDVLNLLITEFFPKYIVLLGDKAKKAYGITLPLLKCHKTILNSNIIVIDINKSIKIKESLDFINSLILKENKELSQKEKIDIPEEQILERLENDWILFDIQTLDNNVLLYTLTNNKTSEKKYIKKEVEYPIYIKYGSFSSCEYISDNVDQTILLSSEEKEQLSRQLNWNIRNLIKNV